MEREQIIKVLECYPDKMICAIVENNRTLFVTNETVLSLIKELTEENDRLSTALAEYEHKTNIRISEEYVPYDDYEELREENKKLIEDCENYKKIAEYQQNISMDRYFEIKRLNKENKTLKEKADRNLENLKAVLEERNENTIVADTVKKMQERLREAPIKVGLPLFGLQTKGEVEDYANELILQMRDAIDQIAKEMLEENK